MEMEESLGYPIVFICPTRKRPHNVKRLIESFLNKAEKLSNIQFYFYVDSDDLETQSLIGNIQEDNKRNIINFVVGERIIMCEMSNILARMAPRDSLLFFCGDDVVCNTLGWDTIVRTIFLNLPKDKIALLFGDDGINGPKLATHFFVHKNWIDALGHMTPSIFTGDWADNWVSSTASRIGRMYYNEKLKLTHMHPTIGKAEFDDTYIEKYQRDRLSKPMNFFNKHADLWLEDVEKLEEFIRNYND